MRFFYKVFLVFIFLFSCDSEDDKVSPDPLESEPELINLENYEEYILLELEDHHVIFSDKMKNYKKENLGVELVSRVDYDGNRYNSLKLWGVIEDQGSRELRRLGITIQYFYGKGIYETGKQYNSNCNYFDLGTSWYSHYAEQGNGYVEITSFEGGSVKGNIDLMVHNSNNRNLDRKITGIFKLNLEDRNAD